jgi:tRNA A37 threonylcarbamoyladenosine dehydratase
MAPADAAHDADADAERRFGALSRLYGEAGYARLRALRVAVVGLGGVGSWAAEALARCGVAGLTLIDLDQVAESNINRQVQALGATLGQAKVLALRERIADIHPGCAVDAVEAFVDERNWPALLPRPVDAVLDACDQARAKVALAAWALPMRVPFVSVGAAGGKRRAQAVEVDDLAHATHDPLLAALRQRLRRAHGAPRRGAIGLRCVFSREAVALPWHEAGAAAAPGAPGMPLACAGYGSSVMVTATFGLVAAGEIVAQALGSRGAAQGPCL